MVKGIKTIQWGKNSLFNKWCLKNWIQTCKRVKLNPYLTPYSKWITDLNERAEIIKILEENKGVNIHNLGFGNRFLVMILKAQATKDKNTYWASKFKTFAFYYQESEKTTHRRKYLQIIYLISSIQNIQRTLTTQQQKDNPIKQTAIANLIGVGKVGVQVTAFAEAMPQKSAQGSDW